MKGICDPKVGAIWFPSVGLGFSFTLLSYYTSYFHGDFILPAGESVELSARLAYALRCSFPMVISLLVGILIIGAKRAFTDAVNPLSGNDGPLLVDKLYLSNTLEQFVVGLTLMLTIATYAETPQVLRLLPAYSFVFTVGRVLFRVGYSYHGMYRSLGMSMNLGAVFVMVIVAAYYVCTGGLTSGLGLSHVQQAEFTATKGEQCSNTSLNSDSHYAFCCTMCIVKCNFVCDSYYKRFVYAYRSILLHD